MSDNEDTKAGAVDDDAMQRVKDRKAETQRQLDAAWNTGRNSVDPGRTKKSKIDHN